MILVLCVLSSHFPDFLRRFGCDLGEVYWTSNFLEVGGDLPLVGTVHMTRDLGKFCLCEGC